MGYLYANGAAWEERFDDLRPFDEEECCCFEQLGQAYVVGLGDVRESVEVDVVEWREWFG